MTAPTKTKPAYPGKVAIRHAVEAARALGLDVGGFEVTPEGTIRVLEARALTKPLGDDLFSQLEARGEI
jgi:hypothetical protein